jgi:hypothetical protein
MEQRGMPWQAATDPSSRRQAPWSTIYLLAGTYLLSREAIDYLLSAPLRNLNLLLEDLPPFLALRKNVLFCFREGFINPLPLEEIAGLAGGDHVIHAPRAALGVRVNVIDGQDQPAFKIVQSVETTVATLELISLENLHCLFAAQVGCGSSEKLC